MEKNVLNRPQLLANSGASNTDTWRSREPRGTCKSFLTLTSNGIRTSIQGRCGTVLPDDDDSGDASDDDSASDDSELSVVVVVALIVETGPATGDSSVVDVSTDENNLEASAERKPSWWTSNKALGTRSR